MMRYSRGIVALLLATTAASAADLSVRSPDGRVEVTVSANAAGQPTYAVAFRGRQVIAPSVLGFQFERYQKLGPGLAVTGQEVRSGRDTYDLTAAKVSHVDEAYNEITVHLAETGSAHRRLDLTFRAYNGGAAFRTHLPQQPGMEHGRLFNENTQFLFPADYKCWGLNLGKFRTSHEGEYDPVQASAIRPHALYELPLTCRTGEGDTSFAITEANLADYAGLYLTGTETGALGVEAKLSPRIDDPAVAVVADVGPAGVTSPWRVILLGDTPGALAEATLVTSLNPPAAGDFAWVKPGKTSWDWWNGPTLKALGARAGTNDATEKAYIDFAAANGLAYHLIDEGWYVNSGGGGTLYPGADPLTTVPAIHLPALVRYASERHVGLWLWFNWQLVDRDMDRVLGTYAAMGIKGIKIDFMDRDDQQMVDFYQRIVAATAKHHLMLDLHGAYAPRGMIRTWPNFITQEGVMGAEYNKWTHRVTATHNVTLPFTRGLAGPYDYTPGGFRNATPSTFEAQAQTPMVQTTRGAALAMYVVFDSPFMGVSDSPDNYANAAGFDFIRAVPTAWDESHVLSGVIGERIVTARRKGREWYVGAMTNEEGRTARVPLDFLGGGRWTATIWQDGARSTDVVEGTRSVTAADVITLDLAPSGGGAIRLVPAK